MLTAAQKTLVKQLFDNQNTFATTLAVLMFDNYKAEWLDWEIETIERELLEDFNVILSGVNRDKLLALQLVITTDQFYTDWVAFNSVCEAFNSDPVDHEILDPATPEQAAWAVAEVALFENPDDAPEYTLDIKNYIGVLLSSRGVYVAPAILAFANPKVKPEDFEHDETDKDMVRAMTTRQQEDHNYINEYVKSRMVELIHELDVIPLQNRDSNAWDKFKSRAIERLTKKT